MSPTILSFGGYDSNMAGDSSDICVKVTKAPTDNIRINELKAFFRKEYKAEALFLVKVPGRYVLKRRVL